MMNLSFKNKISQTRVLVMGDVMLDRYWFGHVDRISPEAPVPIALIHKEEHRLGGAANVSRNITALGGLAGVIGIIGLDEAGGQLEKLLLADHVKSHLFHDPTLKTILKLRVIGQNQQLLRIDFEESPQESHLRQIEETFLLVLSNYQAVIFSDYGKGSLQHVQQLIQAARSSGRPVFIDPKGVDYERYAGATVLTPNRAELKAVIGAWSSEAVLAERVQNLRATLGVEYLLLTRSEEGMSLYSSAGAQHIAVQAREVFDVSGAGDTVIATLALLCASGMACESAVEWANKAAGISVGKFGTSVVYGSELWE